MPGAGNSQRNVIRASSPAKLNLCLAVTGKRADGYHDIRSLAVSVGLSDTMVFSLTPGSPLSVVFDGGGSDTDAVRIDRDDNLVTRAVRLLAEFTNKPTDISVVVTKHIPVAAGLGGGSSNAATTLRACNALWGTNCSVEALQELGSRLGSDVPLFFSLPAAEIAGRGERVQPVSLAWDGWCLLVHFPIAVSTPDVYGAWKPGDGQLNSELTVSSLCHADSASAMMPHCVNDLTEAVKRTCPEVATCQARLQALELGPFAMTGAGATFFRLYDDYDGAREAQMKALHAFGSQESTGTSGAGVQVWTLPVPVREVA